MGLCTNNAWWSYIYVRARFYNVIFYEGFEPILKTRRLHGYRLLSEIFLCLFSQHQTHISLTCPRKTQRSYIFKIYSRNMVWRWYINRLDVSNGVYDNPFLNVTKNVLKKNWLSFWSCMVSYNFTKGYVFLPTQNIYCIKNEHKLSMISKYLINLPIIMAQSSVENILKIDWSWCKNESSFKLVQKGYSFKRVSKRGVWIWI